MFNRLFGKTPKEEPWPDGVPKLYPDLGPAELCDYLSEDEYQRIKTIPRVVICSFASSENDSKSDYLFGVGLSRLLIRNLMLVREFSVLGPGDSYKVPYEQIREHLEAGNETRSNVFVLGKFQYDDGFQLNFEFWKKGKLLGESKVQATEFHEFLLKCSNKIAKSLRGKVDKALVKKWRASLPAVPESLVHLGELILAYDADEGDAKNNAIVDYASKDPNFGLLWTEAEGDNKLRSLLHAFELDPYDAHTCFGLFIAIWKSNGEYEPEAVQFLRRAIELSPGHGKAHMCSPHAAHRDSIPKMIKHSELGYLLLRGNSFAINNYINNLIAKGGAEDLVIKLCREGILVDPDSPGCHNRLIDQLVGAKKFREALEAAKVVQRLYEPEMNPRALYSLKQNPRMAELIESEQYDPRKANQDFIDQMQAYCEQNGL